MKLFATRAALVAASLCLLSPADPARGTDQESPDAIGESTFLTRIRRLTFEGRRAGEGYFSSDGKKLVFQSERSTDNPFYQIFLMDLETGETEPVSPGHGKTTCAFLRPGTGDVLFGSTHHDPESERLQRQELELRASGEERRYAWDYDAEMELWVRVTASGELIRLTHARGYDAEASYSPDGEWIVFASTRSAYEGDLSEEEANLLEINPSFFGELYRIRSDGTGLERLTDAPGYDGGPFFFPGGDRIVWRRFDRDGMLADIWTANPDGSDPRQITDFGAMSWAPYVHPSGDYVLFASNKLGFSNFEVFMVDVEGLREPVRVTYTDGFDGLPVPSPDGKSLVWTSSRHKGEGGQLYMGSWDHEAAMDALASSPMRATE
ncbi:MAG: TolB family protein [Thermoanaerobaculia bacterium]